MRKRSWLWSSAGIALMLALLAWSAGALAQSGPVKMEWFSWSIFRFTSPTGKVVLTNPFVTNPDSPVKVADFPKVDVILVADGHGDEVGSSDEIAIKTGAKIIAPANFSGYTSSREKFPRLSSCAATLATGIGSTASRCGASTRSTGRARRTRCTAGPPSDS